MDDLTGVCSMIITVADLHVDVEEGEGKGVGVWGLREGGSVCPNP